MLFGLAVTEQAGYTADQGTLARGAGWLVDHLEAMDPRTQAFALYSLALAGFPEEDASLALADEALRLDPFSQAALALALSEVGQTGPARAILEDLKAALVRVGAERPQET